MYGFSLYAFCFDNVKVAILLRALISHSEKKKQRQTGQIYRIKKIGIERFDAEYNYRRKDECAGKKKIDKKISLSAQEIFHYFR